MSYPQDSLSVRLVLCVCVTCAVNLKKFDRAHDHFTQALDLVKLRGKRAADRPKLVHQVHHEALQLLEGAEPRIDQEQGGGAWLS